MVRAFLILLVLLGSVVSGSAQTSFPMITHTHPVAVQRGRVTEVTVEGQQPFGLPHQVLFEGDDIKAEAIETPPPKGQARELQRSVKLRVTVDAKALPGPREFRIATNWGVSSLGQIVIVDAPVVVETGDNNTLSKANDLAVPGVACGRIEAVEDVDFYRFHAQAGHTLTFEVQGARLEDKIHDLQKHLDPVLFLYDASGREVASNDDGLFADSCLTHRFTQGGEYFIMIRNSNFDGDPRWVYALAVTDRPFVTQVHPLAVNPGRALDVELIGPSGRWPDRGRIEVPTDALPGVAPLPLWQGNLELNPASLWITQLPVIDVAEMPTRRDRPHLVPLPACVNGRIEKPRDQHHYAVSLKRGQVVQCEVIARRFATGLISKLDGVLDILDQQGRILASGDDALPTIKDPRLSFTAPADGTYVIRLRDLHNQGGAGYVYAMEVREAKPDFSVRVDGTKVMVGPGSSMPWYVAVTRQNGFVGPIAVHVEGLPAGVTVSPLVIPPSMTQGVLVFTAGPNAELAAAKVRVFGVAEVKDGNQATTIRRDAVAVEEIYLPGGGRGRFDVSLQIVGVTAASDIARVEVSPAEVVLKPGEEIKLMVHVVRGPRGKDANVTLDVRLRHLGGVFGDPLPPGVTMVEGKSKTLLAKENQGWITLRADANAAPISNVPIAVVAHVTINFVVKVGYAAPIVPVTVRSKS